MQRTKNNGKKTTKIGLFRSADYYLGIRIESRCNRKIE